MVRALESVVNKAEISNERFVAVFTTLVLSTICRLVVLSTICKLVVLSTICKRTSWIRVTVGIPFHPIADVLDSNSFQEPAWVFPDIIVPYMDFRDVILKTDWNTEKKSNWNKTRGVLWLTFPQLLMQRISFKWCCCPSSNRAHIVCDSFKVVLQ